MPDGDQVTGRERGAEPPFYDAMWRDGQPWLICKECGATVVPQPDATADTHREWHERLSLLVSEAVVRGRLR